MLVQPTPSQCAALTSCLSSERLTPYRRAKPDDIQEAVRLYLWNLRLTAAFSEIIAVAEVVLRNAMHRELTATYGAQWYCRAELFDDRTLRALSTAWEQVTLPGRQNRTIRDVPAGKLIAETMLGLWVNLLDAGGFRGREPARVKVDYELSLWRPALHRAFPHSDGRRRTVHRMASHTRAMRNRIAHHETLLNGVTLHGEHDQHGRPRRLTITESHDCVLRLVAFIDTDVHAWLSAASRVPQVLTERP